MPKGLGWKLWVGVSRLPRLAHDRKRVNCWLRAEGLCSLPVGLWRDAEHDGAAADQENYAAAMRRIRSSCSDWDSAPMVKASRRLSERAKRRASSWRWRSSPCPRIFMPTMPLPTARISRRTARTVLGSASMYAPTGLMRTRSTSTQGDLAAARSASMLWHEQP